MILPYKYDFEVHDFDHHAILPHLKEERLGLQKHWSLKFTLIFSILLCFCLLISLEEFNIDTNKILETSRKSDSKSGLDSCNFCSSFPQDAYWLECNILPSSFFFHMERSWNYVQFFCLWKILKMFFFQCFSLSPALILKHFNLQNFKKSERSWKFVTHNYSKL